MNKKALSNALVAIIIAIISGLMIIGIVLPALSLSREGHAENLCKTSVLIRAGTVLKPVGKIDVHVSPILCKTLTPTIKEEKEKVSRAIADKMAKCWEMLGAGIYENSVLETTNLGGGKSCFTCYVLPVEETRDFKEGKDAIPPQEFMDFLRTAKYPAGSERTYLNYFQTAGGSGNVIIILTEKGIEPNHAYAVSYKAGTGSCTKCGVWGGAGLTGIGGVLMVIPLGVTQVIGGALILAGLATTVISSYHIEANDLLDEAAIDTIILSDITNPEVEAVMRQKCNFVEDIEGKKLK